LPGWRQRAQPLAEDVERLAVGSGGDGESHGILRVSAFRFIMMQ
jgi:hypothetical protein